MAERGGHPEVQQRANNDLNGYMIDAKVKQVSEKQVQ